MIWRSLSNLVKIPGNNRKLIMYQLIWLSIKQWAPRSWRPEFSSKRSDKCLSILSSWPNRTSPFPATPGQKFNQSASVQDKRMSPERCAYLSAVGIANRLDEVSNILKSCCHYHLTAEMHFKFNNSTPRVSLFICEILRGPIIKVGPIIYLSQRVLELFHMI